VFGVWCGVGVGVWFWCLCFGLRGFGFGVLEFWFAVGWFCPVLLYVCVGPMFTIFQNLNPWKP